LPQTIVIAGASSGLGEALAVEYAAPDVNLALGARRVERLEDIARKCRDKGAGVSVAAVDVTDAAAVTEWIGEVAGKAPIDLLIVCAGIFAGRAENDHAEAAEATVAQLRTNLEGNIHVIGAAVPFMVDEGRGRIAIVSSLAALQPQADAQGYTASKAGLSAYGEALRDYLADHKIGVSLIYPGHVATAQTVDHVGALPMMISAERAARIVRRSLDRGRSTIVFPWPLHLLIALGRVVPWQVRAWFNRPFRFHVGPKGGKN